jgi:peptidyl-prolyl cis-trans isomerase B (cyclophilin B)
MKKFTKHLVAFAAILMVAATTLTACGEPKQFNQQDMPEKGEEIAIITTNHGVIKAKFFPEHAPESSKNFVTLSKEGKYNGNIFHRIVPGFVLQGGDFTNQNGLGGHSYKGPGTTIGLEIHPELRHVQGALSMARKGNDINSNGSQFFIVTPDEGTPSLDDDYSVFGQVFDGMDVVKKIEAVETDGGSVPLEPVVMETVEIVEFE